MDVSKLLVLTADDLQQSAESLKAARGGSAIDWTERIQSGLEQELEKRFQLALELLAPSGEVGRLLLEHEDLSERLSKLPDRASSERREIEEQRQVIVSRCDQLEREADLAFAISTGAEIASIIRNWPGV